MKKTKIKKDLSNKIKEIGSGSTIRGITLISLVITIVILIILAGVLINISLGNNGLFNKAKTAKEMYTNAQEYEDTEIAKMTNEIDSYVGGNRNSNVEIVTAYKAQNSDIVSAISLAPYKLSDYDYIMITGREKDSKKIYTSSIYDIESLFEMETDIAVNHDSSFTWYSVTNDNTLTLDITANSFYIYKIQLIKIN